jgi:predicted nucleic acid-binding protein
MASKIFLDANVILEYILERKQAEVVDSLFVEIEKGTYKAYTSVSILQICSYWIEKSFGSIVTKKLLLNLLKDVAILDGNHEYITLALNSQIEDIEDAFQYYTALQYHMNFFITLDKHFLTQAIPILPIYLPAKFLQL